MSGYPRSVPDCPHAFDSVDGSQHEVDERHLEHVRECCGLRRGSRGSGRGRPAAAQGPRCYFRSDRSRTISAAMVEATKPEPRSRHTAPVAAGLFVECPPPRGASQTVGAGPSGRRASKAGQLASGQRLGPRELVTNRSGHDRRERRHDGVANLELYVTAGAHELICVRENLEDARAGTRSRRFSPMKWANVRTGLPLQHGVPAPRIELEEEGGPVARAPLEQRLRVALVRCVVQVVAPGRDVREQVAIFSVTFSSASDSAVTSARASPAVTWGSSEPTSSGGRRRSC